MALLTAKQQRDLLIAAGLIDFVTRGKITAAAYDALKAVVTRAGPPVARGAGAVSTAVAPAVILPRVTKSIKPAAISKSLCCFAVNKAILNGLSS